MHRVNKHQIKKGNLLKNRFYSQLSSYYDLENNQDDTLIFESRFESGNLHQAYKVGQYEYNLYLQGDTGSTRHLMWFYFRMQNVKKGIKYRFNINNFQNV